jgi:hypothetical protein
VFDDPNLSPPPRQGISTYTIVSLVVFGLAVAYVVGVFYMRWHGNRVIEERAAETERSHDEKVVQAMGGDRFEILNFYANPAVIQRGDSTTLCYSVSNAKSVTLQPQSNAVWPAFERCVSVSPKKTITYTFTATDASGNTKSATAMVVVH